MYPVSKPRTGLAQQTFTPQNCSVNHKLDSASAGSSVGTIETSKTIDKRLRTQGTISTISVWKLMQHKWLVTYCAMKRSKRQGAALLQHYQVGLPMETVAVDIAGPLPITKAGNIYICVARDYYTKWLSQTGRPLRQQGYCWATFSPGMVCWTSSTRTSDGTPRMKNFRKVDSYWMSGRPGRPPEASVWRHDGSVQLDLGTRVSHTSI